jgi:hypothetical protein
MKLEKTLSLENGRSVKVITQPVNPTDPSKFEIDVLIKEPRETHYRPPIGLTHPKYWTLKRMDSNKSRQMQIQYSGLSEKQVRNVLKELKNELLN